MLIPRLVSLAVLGLSLAWWVVDPGFEPVITGLAAIAGLVSAGLASGSRKEKADKSIGGARAARRVDLAASPPSFTPAPHAVGRRDVVDALRGELDHVRGKRRGKLVCVTGESGIGKTTVSEHFLSELARDDTALVARGRCSERLAGVEAYLPLLEALESLLRGAGREAVRDVMASTAPSWYGRMGAQHEAAIEPESVGELSQERLKREIARFFECMSDSTPIVLFLEDLHWADVSTIDVLAYLADRFDAHRTFVLATYRPEEMRLTEHPFLRVRSTLAQRGLLTEIGLRFLRIEEVEEYLGLEYPNHAFPTGLARAVHDRTEGSPLFVVALLRYLQEQGVISEERGRWTLTRPIEEVERRLPTTVASMIERKTARLDESDRELLGLAAVQGYEFDAVVTADAMGRDVASIEQQLSRLERNHGLVTRTGDEELADRTLTARYEFVHNVYQHTFLESVGTARRIAWSGRVAEAVVEHHGGDNPAVAAELGVLFEAAREFERAATCLQTAARHALLVSAPTEALALSRRGVRLLDNVPEGPERDALELPLLTTLGNALTMSAGWGGAREVTQTYERARKLAERTGQFSAVHPLLIQGLFHHWTQRDVPKVLQFLDDQRAMAQQSNDPVIMAHVHWLDGNLRFWRGEVGAARPHFDKAMAAYVPGQDGARFLYGQDPGIASRSYASWNLCLAGYPEQASALASDCVTRAEQLRHPFTTVYGLIITAWVSILHRDFDGSLKVAERAIRLAEEHEWPFYTVYAGMQRAWAGAHLGALEPGLREMSDLLERYQEMGSVLSTTFFLALFAEMHCLGGQEGEGLSAIDRALLMSEDIEEFTFAAELHRLRGDLLRLGSRHVEAERSYRTAIAVSSRQESKWFQLRAAASLGRLLLDGGRAGEAEAVLDEAYRSVPEGHRMPDVRNVRTLLQECH